MKKINNLCIMAVLTLFVTSCDNNDDANPIDPNTFANATVSYDGPNTVDENVGNLNFTIELDKASKNNTNFTVSQIGGTAVEDVDFILPSLTIPAYLTQSEFSIQIIDNPFPQQSRTVTLEVFTPEFGSELLNPNSNIPYTIELTINDINSTEGVTVGLDWNHDHAGDLDMFLFNSSGGLVNLQATADAPEIAIDFIPDALAPDGTYYLGIDPYEYYEPQIEFNFGISDSSGNVHEFSGVFDTENLGSYDSDYYAPWATTSYRLIQIDKSGTNYTFTQLF